MPRIRTMKPEFWGDEKLGALPPIDRLVFLGLICMADDAGRLVDNVKTIDGFLFPKTDDSSRKSLETLFSMARIVRYTSGSGQDIIQIANWKRHQKVNHPSSYVLPPPAKQDKDLATGAEKSLEARKKVSRKVLAPTNDLRSTTKEDIPTAPPRRDHGAVNGNHISHGWPAAWAEAYKAIGILEPGRIGKRCGVVREEYGAEKADKMWGHYIKFRPMQRFGDIVQGHYDVSGMGPEDFVKTAGVWSEYCEPFDPAKHL